MAAARVPSASVQAAARAAMRAASSFDHLAAKVDVEHGGMAGRNSHVCLLAPREGQDGRIR